MTADRKGPSEDDKRRLIEEVQRKWSIDGGASERDSPLSFARECIDLALARFAAPRGLVTMPEGWEIRRLDKYDSGIFLGVDSLEYTIPNWLAEQILDAPPRGEEG